MVEPSTSSTWHVRDKLCLVTGATNGIGKQTALGLASRGARVVVVARNRAKGDATVREISAATSDRPVELLLCDFASQRSIRAAAAEVLARFPAIHVLVNNAGVMNVRREVTEDGLEATFAVNHLGYFLFTTLLLDRIIASAPARIVSVASDAHKFGAVDIDDLQNEHGYGAMRVYGQSKGCNLLFNAELAKRLEGTGVTTNAVHPGAVSTGLGANHGSLLALIQKVAMVFMKSPVSGADTSVYLATSPEVDGVSGGYFFKRKPRASTTQTRDPNLAAQLWTLSEALVADSAVTPS
jgi:NAD(P)-dependent dehydrogenase (short-subunit alcohol dehydrogenase family)